VSDDEQNGILAYEVQFQDTGSKEGEWWTMTGRTYNERYRHPGHSNSTHETASMDEAVEIAEALVRGISHPTDPHGQYHRHVVAAQVVTRLYFGTVTAVYGKPVGSEEATDE
jgi:hypothetical protein